MKSKSAEAVARQPHGLIRRLSGRNCFCNNLAIVRTVPANNSGKGNRSPVSYSDTAATRLPISYNIAPSKTFWRSGLTRDRRTNYGRTSMGSDSELGKRRKSLYIRVLKRKRAPPRHSPYRTAAMPQNAVHSFKLNHGRPEAGQTRRNITYRGDVASCAKRTGFPNARGATEAPTISEMAGVGPIARWREEPNA